MGKVPKTIVDSPDDSDIVKKARAELRAVLAIPPSQRTKEDKRRYDRSRYAIQAEKDPTFKEKRNRQARAFREPPERRARAVAYQLNRLQLERERDWDGYRERANAKQRRLRTSSPNAAYNAIKGSAKVGGRIFNITRKTFQELLFRQPCNYCGRMAFGVDRKVNDQGYEIGNCVPCCKECNIAKGKDHTNVEFIDICRHLAMRFTGGIIGSEHQQLFQSSQKTAISHYKHSARTRNLEWALTAEQFQHLVSSPCIYCGKESSWGIDRVVNVAGYVTENAVSCCKTCNFIKHTLSLNEFKMLVSRVALYHDEEDK